LNKNWLCPNWNENRRRLYVITEDVEESC